MDKIEPLHGLVEFVAAADAGSFSAAARPSASRSHSQPEGGRTRTRARASVDPAHVPEERADGRRTELPRQLRALLEGLDEAREALRRDQAEVRGSIRLSVGGHFAEERLAPLLVGSRTPIRLEPRHRGQQPQRGYGRGGIRLGRSGRPPGDLEPRDPASGGVPPADDGRPNPARPPRHDCRADGARSRAMPQPGAPSMGLPEGHGGA